MTKEEYFEEILKDAIRLHNSKNSDYGDSYSKVVKELGSAAMLVPLYNKLDRFKTLILNQSENHFESIEDTLLDLVSYAAMAYAEIEKKKEETGSTPNSCDECDEYCE